MILLIVSGDYRVRRPTRRGLSHFRWAKVLTRPCVHVLHAITTCRPLILASGTTVIHTPGWLMLPLLRIRRSERGRGDALEDGVIQIL